MQTGAVQGGYSDPGDGCSLKKDCLYPFSILSSTFSSLLANVILVHIVRCYVVSCACIFSPFHVQLWLSLGKDVSWGSVVEALTSLEMKKDAQNIKENYCKPEEETVGVVSGYNWSMDLSGAHEP